MNGDTMRKLGFLEKLKIKINDFIQKRKREKEKKKKEKEELILWQCTHGVKSYSKPQVVFFTFLGLFVGLFEKKADTQKEVLNLKNPKVISIVEEDEKKVEKIVVEIQVLEEKIEKEKEVQKIVVYKEELLEKKRKLEDINEKYPEISTISKAIPAVLTQTILTTKRTKKALEKTEQVLQKAIEKEKKILIQEKKEEEKKLQKVQVQKQSKVGTVTKVIKETRKIPKEIFKEEKEEVSLDQTQILTALTLPAILIQKEEKKVLGKKEKKEVNQTLDKIKIDEIENKIKETDDPILLQECIEALEKLKESKIEDKKSKERCEELEKKAQARKEELTKKKRVRSEEDLAEILYMETLIHNHLKKQKRELRRFHKQINRLEPVYKKLGFLSGIKRFLSHTIRFTFSLFPVAFFKNKKLGLLTSAVLVNNSIRSMRNSMNRVQIPYVEYEKIAETIRKSKVETEKAQMLCYDSLDQIAYLKEDFLREVGYEMSSEVEDILKEMDQLEKMIESRTKELEKMNGTLSYAREKSKQKIKKMESMYNKYP